MFMMNPAAKEFVPAHILKKRQEDAERLCELTEQMDKVNIASHEEKSENKGGNEHRLDGSSRDAHENDLNKQSSKENLKSEQESSTSSINQQSNHLSRDVRVDNQPLDTNNHYANERQAEQESNEEDDRFLLNPGENLCEFNGEQFIIPGDDEYEPPIRAGYDFGNDEDNEDEDVCDAFEEFLENLPNQ